MIKRYVNDFGQNTYLHIEKKDAVLIDAATRSEAIKKDLHKEGASLRAVLLTHGHYDHIARLEEILAAFPVQVHIHPEDEAFLFDPSLNLSQLFGKSFALPDKERVAAFTKEEELAFGALRVAIHHTPGHTRGSVVYQIGEALYTGDTLFKGSIGRTDLPGGDERTLAGTLERLKKDFGGKLRIFPGHGEESLLAKERQENPFL